MTNRQFRLGMTAVLFLAAGIGSAAAQDFIFLRDGNMIEAKIAEISPAEIRYKRFDRQDGPVIVVPAAGVLTIRYEDGAYEIINAAPAAEPVATPAKVTAMNPDKFHFGINANAGGAIGYAWESPTGAGINIELGKGKFNSEINLMFPIGGFGALVTFNGFFPSRIGGAYVGGGIGYSYYGGGSSLPVGLNLGYKFVTKSGMYYRTGAFAGFDFGLLWGHGYGFYFKPDLSIGWTMK